MKSEETQTNFQSGLVNLTHVNSKNILSLEFALIQLLSFNPQLSEESLLPFNRIRIHYYRFFTLEESLSYVDWNHPILISPPQFSRDIMTSFHIIGPVESLSLFTSFIQQSTDDLWPKYFLSRAPLKIYTNTIGGPYVQVSQRIW